MNLREQAEADNAFLLEDSVAGFGVEITLTDLDGNVYQVVGQYSRVGVDIDPETGLLVPGNKSSATVRLASLRGALPEEGWLVETKDITGAMVRGRATSVMLDRTAGRATMIMRK
jgi:hypothetical protein